VTFPRHRVYGGGGAAVARQGATVAQGKHLVDMGGRFRPLSITFFSQVWGVRHDAARYLQNAQTAAGYGVHAPRILGEVGGSSWADRVINPLESTYETDLSAAIDTNWSLGMRTILTIFGGGCIDGNRQQDVDLTVGKVINVVQPRLDRILAIEIANEDNFPGSPDDMKRVARLLRSALPSVVLMPCSLGNLEPTEPMVAPDMCNAQNLHQERQPGDLDWRQARQLYGYHYGYPCGALEPMGVALMQHEDLNDPVRYAFCRAVGLLYGFQVFTLHTGPGVRTGGAYDVNMGRASNFYDVCGPITPTWGDLAASAAMLNTIETIVPLDVADWIKTSQHGRDPFADNFLFADAIWSDEGEDHGVSRSYLAYSGNAFCCLSYGVKHYANLIARASITATIYDIRHGTESPFVVGNGGSYRLPGDAAADPGYIIVGQRG
jgi:hypothetical protein